MNEIINGELSITLPEGFRPMTAEELKRGYASDFANIKGFWDERRHAIVTITWNESSGLMAKLTNVKALAKRAEKHLARAYRNLGYRSDGLFSTKLAGQEACGLRYSYALEGVAHDAETIVFMQGACCYTLYYYTRSENAAGNAKVRDEVYSSLAFR